MKKIAIIFTALAIAVFCTSCTDNINDQSNPENVSSVSSVKDETNYKIALITDNKGVSDDNNRTAWYGIVTYGDSTSRNYKYYTTENNTSAAGIKAINQAIENRAEIVVLPSDTYKHLAYTAQENYPKTSFILVEAMPTEEISNSSDSDSFTSAEIKIAKNTHCIYFKEEQSGYLAGYLSVMEGYKSLAFIGDAKNDKNMRYAYGFIQGANDAAKENRVNSVNVKYTFIEPNAENAVKVADTLYEDKTDVIFSCNDTISSAVADAAKKSNKKMISGGSNYSNFGDVQLTAVVNEINEAVELSLSAFYSNGGVWPEGAAGKALKFGIENGCISPEVDEDWWNFSYVTTKDVEKLMQNFVDGNVKVSSDIENPPKSSRVSFTEIES